MPNYLLADGQRTEKARFWWHWLDATNGNPEEEWRWTVKEKEIPLSVTPTYWDFEEPANSKLIEKKNKGIAVYLHPEANQTSS